MKPLSYRTIYSADVSRQQSQLVNRQFDDIYHHPDAIAESRYVFHQGNHLIQQWYNCASNASFVIAETGFGSGLNFLTTRQLWQNTNQKPKHLHFISTEQWLLTPEQLDKVYAGLPDLLADFASIRSVFCCRRSGFHSFTVDSDITLTLLLGDATACFQQLRAEVNAWFLDGFSPAKNPDMWSSDLFTEIARLSSPGATFATFTAASKVRKNLQSVGFEVSKTSGFQGKRERLIGQFNESPSPMKNKQLWAPISKAQSRPKRITIIGGGIAGMCLAKTAKNNGLHVTLIDQYRQPLSGASGNAYAMMMPYLTAQSSPDALFYWRAFDHAVRFYPRSVFHPIGVKSGERFKYKDARNGLPDDLIQTTNQGVMYSGSGYICTDALSQHLVSAIDRWITADVDNIKQSAEGQWLIQDAQQQTIDCCDVLVVAAGIQSSRLLPFFKDFISARRGQTELYQLPDWPTSLNNVQLSDRYLIPIKSIKQVLMGGDYQHLDSSDWLKTPNPKAHDSQLNLKYWQNNTNSESLNRAELVNSRVGIRCHTLDHLPLCGPVVDSEQFKHDYADLHHGRHWQQYPPASVHKNLYVLSGLGSRGYTSAPILANYLMAMIMNQPLPIEQDLVKILHPNRFLYRQLKKPPKD